MINLAVQQKIALHKHGKINHTIASGLKPKAVLYV